MLRQTGLVSSRESATLAPGAAPYSHSLVVRGEPGVGRTSLPDDLESGAVGWRVVRATGVDSERELAFAGLHQPAPRCSIRPVAGPAA